MPFPPQGAPLAQPLKLSLLEIDVDKDWGGRRIPNIGVPTAAGDVLRKGTRQTLTEAPDGSTDLVLTGTGLSANPIYAGVTVPVVITDPAPELGVIWFDENENKWKIWIKGEPFGTIIRYGPSPGTFSWGVGGTDTSIWHVDYSPRRIHQLSVADFSSLRSTVSALWAYGIGGDDTTIWHTGHTDAQFLYELSTADFSVIRNTWINLWKRGVGGDASVIWVSDDLNDRIEERSVVDLAIIRVGSSPSLSPRGVGGTKSTIWHCSSEHAWWELSVVDFAGIRSANPPGSAVGGIGGDNGTVWFSDTSNDRIYELATGWTIGVLINHVEVGSLIHAHNQLTAPHPLASAFGGKPLGLADGNLAILPVATDGQVLLRGATVWGAAAVPKEIVVHAIGTEPEIAANDVAIWNDTALVQWWLVFGTDGTVTGNKKVQLI